MISKTVGSGLLGLKTKPSVATSILKTNNKSMKTKIFALLAVLVMFAGVMTSCDKSMNEPMAPVISNDDISSSAQGELRSLSDFATGAYSIDQIYKNEYSHIYQYDNSATSTYPNGWPGGTTGPGNCSWSNYIMAVGCVGRASRTIDSDDYKLDKARRLKEFMKNSRGSYLRGAVMQYIYEDYGLIYDNSNRVGVRHWTTSKSRRNHAVITEELLKHLRDFKTPIVMIGATAGGYGHYFTIVSIVWGGTIESSDIWFCDSTQGSTGDSFSESAQSLPLKTFLNRMSNGSSSDYTRCNVLFTYNLNL